MTTKVTNTIHPSSITTRKTIIHPSKNKMGHDYGPLSHVILLVRTYIWLQAFSPRLLQLKGPKISSRTLCKLIESLTATWRLPTNLFSLSVYLSTSLVILSFHSSYPGPRRCQQREENLTKGDVCKEHSWGNKARRNDTVTTTPIPEGEKLGGVGGGGGTSRWRCWIVCVSRCTQHRSKTQTGWLAGLP